MRTDGPEFRNGWQALYEFDGAEAIVKARHYGRSRVPTPHELVLQSMRGQSPRMVQDPVHEWSVLLEDGRLGRCTIRPTPSGMFQVAGIRQLHRTIEEAVRGWAAPIVARRAEAARIESEREPGGDAPAPLP